MYANYYVPIINLSNYNNSNQERQKLKLVWMKDVQRFLAANIGSLAYNIKGNNDDKNLEHFHEFLCVYTDIFSNNIFATKDKDYTYHNLSDMIQTKNIVVTKGEKDSNIVTMKRSDYVTPLDSVINDGIVKGTCIENIDNML